MFCLQSFSEKNDEQQLKLEAGQEALSLVEEYKTIETDLREQVGGIINYQFRIKRREVWETLGMLSIV